MQVLIGEINALLADSLITSCHDCGVCEENKFFIGWETIAHRYNGRALLAPILKCMKCGALYEPPWHPAMPYSHTTKIGNVSKEVMLVKDLRSNRILSTVYCMRNDWLNWS